MVLDVSGSDLLSFNAAPIFRVPERTLSNIVSSGRGRHHSQASMRTSSPEPRRLDRSQQKLATRDIFPDNQVLDGQYMERSDGTIIYKQPTSGEIFEFFRPKEPNFHKMFKQATLHPTGSICILESLVDPLLPRPSRQMCHSLKAEFRMTCKPELRRSEHALSTLCDCIDISVTRTYHRQSVLPSVCLKRLQISEKDLEVPLGPDAACFYENAHRAFTYSPEARTHLLTTPQPFSISPRWPPLIYRPAFATCENSRQIRNFFAIFSPAEYREAAAVYMNPPDSWGQAENPYFMEPKEGSELSNVSRELYGLETLFRTAFIRHPCKTSRIRVYIATDQQMNTPILTSADRFSLDDFLAAALRPFYSSGAGRVICPVCLVKGHRDTEPAQLAWLSHPEFLLHYRVEHWAHSISSGLFSPTQLHVRYYSAHFLYTLCMGHSPTACDPAASALVDWTRFPEVETTTLLKNLVVTSPTAPATAATRVLPPGLVAPPGSQVLAKVAQPGAAPSFDAEHAALCSSMNVDPAVLASNAAARKKR